ncbi:MAG: hypothetical protein ACODAU_06075 [Myxococcota bacterium]
MGAMSIGERLVRLGAPVAVAVLFTAVILAGAGSPGADLQLVAPEAAPPGREVALRALLLAELDRPEGPELRQAPVAVRLEASGGGRLASGVLRPSLGDGMEGTIALPAGREGDFRLRARATLDGETVRVQAPLRVERGAPPLASRGRLASPLQQYLPFPVRPVGEAAPPRPFEARIEGGACVPEQACRVLVWVGEPAAAVAVEPTAAVEPVGGAEAARTAGLVAFTVRVHGPEADLHLVARRGGEPVARRTVRLPIAQGAPALELPERILEAPAAPVLRVRGVEPGDAVLVDAFREGHWERSGSAVVGGDGALGTPFDPLGTGVWRLQVRKDVLSQEAAATRMAVVHAPGADRTSAAGQLARRSRHAGFGDRFAGAVLGGEVPGASPTADQVSFLAALHELELIRLPQAHSGHLQRVVGAESTAGTWRMAAALAVLLVGMGVGIYVWRRGIRAQRQARRILEESEGAALGDRGVPWSVVGTAAFVVAVFGTVALLMLSRGGF